MPRESSVAKLQKELALMAMKLEIANQLASARPATTTTNLVSTRPQVGVRNLSNYTVGLTSPVKDEMGVTLNADDPKNRSTLSTAVISYTFWQQLRRSAYVTDGMIVRDDSILGDIYVRAPEDLPGDLSPQAQQNVIDDPEQWITSRTEDQLRTDILAFNCESPLHRLAVEVNRKIREVGEKWAGTSERARQALMHLPGHYQLTDKLVTERLSDLSPFARFRETRERESVRF